MKPVLSWSALKSLGINPIIGKVYPVGLRVPDNSGRAGSAETGLSISFTGSFAAFGTTICQGGAGDLTASGCPSGGVVHWYTASTGGTLIGTGSPFEPRCRQHCLYNYWERI